jgi:hypothetical protein
MPDVVVYLYSQEGPTAKSARAALSSAETGTLSAITDLTGTYYFRDVEPGVYRIQPNFTGLSFEPSTFAIETGDYAPVVQAIPVDLHDDGCTIVRTAEDIVEADARSRQVVLYGLAHAKRNLARARKLGLGSDRSGLVHELHEAVER